MHGPLSGRRFQGEHLPFLLVAIWGSSEPNHYVCSCSFSCLQRLNSQFGTAVVLTSTWVELFSDPRLFAPQLVKSRDHRTLAIFATFLGGMCSTAVVYATNSSAVALGITTGTSCLPKLGIKVSFNVVTAKTDALETILAGLRLVSVLSWLLVPVERDESQ